MEGFVMVDGRVVYPRSGKKKGSKHVKLTVGRNCLTGGQIQHDYTGKTAEEIVKYYFHDVTVEKLW